MKLIRVAILLALLNACGHDTARKNPLDPALTPAVALTAAVSDTGGAVSLEWTRYAGQRPFSAYRVLRAQDGGGIDTLHAAVADIDSTRLLDSFAVHGAVYEYRVSVLNSSGFESDYASITVASIRLPAVTIDTLKLDSETASAALTWTRYAGPRFSEYRVYRSLGSDTRLLGTVSDMDSVSFVDTGLAGNSEYSYRVDVVTQIGEQIMSQASSGSFHRYVSDWPLDLVPGTAFKTNVRLYAVDANRIAALSVDTGEQDGNGSTVKWLTYTADGQLVNTNRLLLSTWRVIRDARTVAAVHDTGASLYLSLSSFGGGVGDAQVDEVTVLLYADVQQSPVPLLTQSLAEAPEWASLAAIGTDLALTINAQPYIVSEGVDTVQVVQRTILDGWVGETRVWRENGQLRAGVCMPADDLVKWGSVFRPSTWESSLRTVVGPHISGPAQTLFYPVSFDAGPDGRIYVLDAGSARILVFDAGGEFITQWGGPGTGVGEFNFGSGNPIVKGRDYAGSIAVDDNGFIYVADVGNRRIQKFAP